MFKNTLKEIKYSYFFNSLPMLAVLVTVITAKYNNIIGLNIYGICELTVEQTGMILIFVIMTSYIIISLYALYILKRFVKMNKARLLEKDEFFGFYLNYILFLIFFYLIIGSIYVTENYIER